MARFLERFYVVRIVVNQPLLLERGYDTEDDALKYAIDVPHSGVVRVLEHAQGFAEGDLESYVNVDVTPDRFDDNTIPGVSDGTPVGRFARQNVGGQGNIRDRAATGEGGGPILAGGLVQNTDPKAAESVKNAEKAAKEDDKARKEGAVEVKTAGADKAQELNAEKEDAPSSRRKRLR